MARKRFITSDISSDEALAYIAAEDEIAALMWPWFLTGFDDWGRMTALPIKIKLEIFPAFSFSPEQIKKAIELYHRHGLVHLYEVNGNRYIAIEPNKFYKYQPYIRKEKRERDESSIPAPQDAPWCTQVHEGARGYAQVREDTRICIPSPSPSPSSNNTSLTNVNEDASASEDDAKISNKELIAELVAEYRKVIPQEKWSKGDYAFIGRLYNQYGYDAILMAINELGYRIDAGFDPEKPLVFLRSLVVSEAKKDKTSSKKPELDYSYLIPPKKEFTDEERDFWIRRHHELAAQRLKNKCPPNPTSILGKKLGEI